MGYSTFETPGDGSPANMPTVSHSARRSAPELLKREILSQVEKLPIRSESAMQSDNQVNEDGEAKVNATVAPSAQAMLPSLPLERRPISIVNRAQGRKHSSLLQRWQEFIREQSEMQKLRIQTDEHRRQTVGKRNVLVENIKQHTLLAQQIRRESTDVQYEELVFRSKKIGTDCAELNEMEKVLDNEEGEIINKESKIGGFVPLITGSNPTITFQDLEGLVAFRHGEESSVSSHDLPSDDDGSAIQVLRQYKAKLTQVSDIEDQLEDLRDEDSRLRQSSASDLDDQARRFLRDYHSDRTRLQEQLRWAQDDVEQLTHRLPPNAVLVDEHA